MSLRLLNSFQKPKSSTDRLSSRIRRIVNMAAIVIVDFDANTPFGHANIVGWGLISIEAHDDEALER